MVLATAVFTLSPEPTLPPSPKSATPIALAYKKTPEDVVLDMTEPSPEDEERPISDLEVLVNQKERYKRRVFAALRLSLLVTIVLGVTVFLGFLIGSDSVQKKTVDILTWLEQLPWYFSASITVLLYSVALVFFCPGTPFNLAAGFLYKLPLGCGVAMSGCILGAFIAFVLGRTIARDWVKAKVEKKPKFRAVDWALHKKGIYIVFLSRLSPLFPFPLLNYAFGITKIKWWQYVVGTTLGVAPGTIGYCYLGTLMRNLTDMWTTTDTDHPNLIWLSVGGGVTVLSIVVISWITQRAISSATRDYELLHNEEGAELETVKSKLSDPEHTLVLSSSTDEYLVHSS